MKASAGFTLLLAGGYSLGGSCHKYFKLLGFFGGILFSETVFKGHAVTQWLF